MRTKSTKPRKQRLYQKEPPRHEAHKLLSSNVSPNIRESKGFRSIPLRKGDTVVITRGDMKGKSGKVTHVNPRKQRVFVDKVQKRKSDNTEMPVPIHPSNLMITKLEEKDRTRLELINRRIKDVEEKIDIDAVLAEIEEEEDIIEIEDDDLLTSTDGEDDDVELLEDLDEKENDDPEASDDTKEEEK
ncbi:MAG: 50S ribosomal protein L24 [Candidatus Hodarchaeales archaeon]|jgi:large subunit ribosomal protein L24